MAKKLRCKHCKGENLYPLDINKKFSVTKGLVGGAIGCCISPLFGAVGAATGIKGKNGKTIWVCQDCGKRMER